MTLARLINSPALLPPEGASYVRRISLMESPVSARPTARPTAPKVADTSVEAKRKKSVAIGDKRLDKARQMLRDGPMTAPYFSAHGHISLSHAKRVLAVLVNLGGAECKRIRGVRPFVYFLKSEE